MKWQAGKGASCIKGKLHKGQVGEMARWQDGKMQDARWQNGKLMKQRVDKWQVDQSVSW